MEPRLLWHYNRELQHIREMGAEFAREFPKIAGRLSLEGIECADPYVERLLEGFAFMAARIQLKLEAEFPRFTQHLLETVFPHYLAPTPSMAVVQFAPDFTEGSLANGVLIPRQSVMRSILGKGDLTAVEYRTAHEVTLWPVEISRAEYLSTPGAVAAIDVSRLNGIRAAIRLRLRTIGNFTFDKLAIKELPIYLRGQDEMPARVYEQLLANAVSVIVRPASRPVPWQEVLDKKSIQRVGFADNQALLPYSPRSFQGYRLLHEYFTLPERFLSVNFTGLEPALRRCAEKEIEIIILLNRSDPALESIVTAANFAMFCSPAINLFPMNADRIHLTDEQTEHHVLPDRTRPQDFEVYEVTSVTGYSTGNEVEQQFLPFYASTDLRVHRDESAYYTVHRLPRMLSSKQRITGPRSSYVGTEVFVALVDGKEAPYNHQLRQLGITCMCTNRDLSLHMAVGRGQTDFVMTSGAPVSSIRCVAGPTKPRQSFAQGGVNWKLISHLSLNYLSLIDNDPRQGAAALRELLSLYVEGGDAHLRKQIDGVRSIASKPIIRRVSNRDRIAFGRGLEISVTLDQSSFEGTGIFLLGAVLEDFFAKYVSINSFTETVIRESDRGEVMRWPVRIGRRETL